MGGGRLAVRGCGSRSCSLRSRAARATASLTAPLIRTGIAAYPLGLLADRASPYVQRGDSATPAGPIPHREPDPPEKDPSDSATRAGPVPYRERPRR